MNAKEIRDVLENSYSGMDTLAYGKRYENGDNKSKTIKWVMGNFNCTYACAWRLVSIANGSCVR